MSGQALNLICGDCSIRFWEAWSGLCGRTINQQPHWVGVVGTIRGDDDGRSCVGTAPQKQVNRLAISPDKRILAAAGHNAVR